MKSTLSLGLIFLFTSCSADERQPVPNADCSIIEIVIDDSGLGDINYLSRETITDWDWLSMMPSSYFQNREYNECISASSNSEQHCETLFTEKKIRPSEWSKNIDTGHVRSFDTCVASELPQLTDQDERQIVDWHRDKFVSAAETSNAEMPNIKVFRASSVAYSVDRDWAVVYLDYYSGGWHGYNKFIFLQNTNGVWIVEGIA